MRAAHPHLRYIEVAAVGDVVSFFFHVYPSFPGGLRFLSLQSTTEEGDSPWQGCRSAYAATVPENKKPPRNGGFTAFLRVWNCINLGVVLSLKPEIWAFPLHTVIFVSMDVSSL